MELFFSLRLLSSRRAANISALHPREMLAYPAGTARAVASARGSDVRMERANKRDRHKQTMICLMSTANFQLLQ